MSRLGRQKQRLKELERIYSCSLQRELVVVAGSGKIWASQYLYHKWQYADSGKSKKKRATKDLEKLEKDILKLRDKLGLPVHGGPIGIIQEWTERISGLSEDGDRRAFAKRALEKLSAEGTET